MRKKQKTALRYPQLLENNFEVLKCWQHIMEYLKLSENNLWGPISALRSDCKWKSVIDKHNPKKCDKAKRKRENGKGKQLCIDPITHAFWYSDPQPFSLYFDCITLPFTFPLIYLYVKKGNTPYTTKSWIEQK